jgi:hypothetical protein
VFLEQPKVITDTLSLTIDFVFTLRLLSLSPKNGNKIEKKANCFIRAVVCFPMTAEETTSYYSQGVLRAIHSNLQHWEEPEDFRYYPERRHSGAIEI